MEGCAKNLSNLFTAVTVRQANLTANNQNIRGENNTEINKVKIQG